jgi:HEAT repeat protein
VTGALRVRFASPNPGQRAEACALAADDPNAVLFVELLDAALADPTPRVARSAGEALTRIAEYADEAARALQRALRGDRPDARWAAVFALARCEPPEVAWLPALALALDHPAGDVRWNALRVLVHGAPLLAEIAPLLEALAAEDPRPRVRRMAAHGLRRLAAPAESDRRAPGSLPAVGPPR